MINRCIDFTVVRFQSPSKAGLESRKNPVGIKFQHINWHVSIKQIDIWTWNLKNSPDQDKTKTRVYRKDATERIRYEFFQATNWISSIGHLFCGFLFCSRDNFFFHSTNSSSCTVLSQFPFLHFVQHLEKTRREQYPVDCPILLLVWTFILRPSRDLLRQQEMHFSTLPTWHSSIGRETGAASSPLHEIAILNRASVENQ